MQIDWDLYVFRSRSLLSLITYDGLQLRDATMGLIYIHDEGVVHGDLKGVRF